jgi:hypothetical protein
MRFCLRGNYSILIAEAYQNSMLEISLKNSIEVVHFESDDVVY